MRDGEEVHERCCGGVGEGGVDCGRGEVVRVGEVEGGEVGCEGLSVGGSWGERAGTEGARSWCYHAVLDWWWSG